MRDINVLWNLTQRTIVNFDYVFMFVKLLVLCDHMCCVALVLTFSFIFRTV
jgi:hypothetical protein